MEEGGEGVREGGREGGWSSLEGRDAGSTNIKRGNWQGKLAIFITILDTGV